MREPDHAILANLLFPFNFITEKKKQPSSEPSASCNLFAGGVSGLDIDDC